MSDNTPSTTVNNSVNEPLTSDNKIVNETVKNPSTFSRPVDENAQGFSISDIAKALNYKRSTLRDKLSAALTWQDFELTGVATGEAKNAKVLYPTEAWVNLLEDVRLPIPECLMPTISSENVPEASITTFVEGNHRTELTLPETPSEIDLGQYRGDAALSIFEDDDIDRFLNACDGFLEATETDYQKQLAITEKKRQNLGKVKAKVEEVKNAKNRYQTRSETLSLINRQLDTDIREGMNTLKSPNGSNAAQS